MSAPIRRGSASGSGGDRILGSSSSGVSAARELRFGDAQLLGDLAESHGCRGAGDHRLDDRRLLVEPHDRRAGVDHVDGPGAEALRCGIERRVRHGLDRHVDRCALLLDRLVAAVGNRCRETHSNRLRVGGDR